MAIDTSPVYSPNGWSDFHVEGIKRFAFIPEVTMAIRFLEKHNMADSRSHLFQIKKFKVVCNISSETTISKSKVQKPNIKIMVNKNYGPSPNSFQFSFISSVFLE